MSELSERIKRMGSGEDARMAWSRKIPLNQSVGEQHVCDIDCWDHFFVSGDAFADPMLGCRNRRCNESTPHDSYYQTLGDIIAAANEHCREYHHGH